MSEFDLTDEEKGRLIDNIARFVVENGLEAPAVMFLELGKPISFVASQFAIMVLAPLKWLFDLQGEKYTGLFMEKENVSRIIDRIESLSKAKG